MSYELKEGERLPHAFRRIGSKRVERVLCELPQGPRNRAGESIHSARKDLKKARAMLRLLRDELGTRIYKRDARHLRKVARALGGPRDIESQLQTVKKLSERYHGKAIRGALKSLREYLLDRQREFAGVPVSNGNDKKLKHHLRATRRDVKHWPVEKVEWRDVARGVGRTYQRGFNAFHAAERARTPANLHEWRKRLKDLWYQLRILRPVRPKALTDYTQLLKTMTDSLGDEHDLFMIDETARLVGLELGEKRAFAKLLCERRVKLERQALEMGRRLYLEKPAAFRRRIERYGE